MSRSYRFSRRSLLASAGLGAAALPLLNARRAFAAPEYPRRLVVLQPTNGVMHDAWWPTTNVETNFTLGPTMAPLEPHKKDIAILRGLEFTVMKQNQPSYVTAWGGHEALPFVLTGAPGARGSYDGRIPVAVGDAISLDWFLGTELAKRYASPVIALNLGVGYVDGKDQNRSISFRGPAVGAEPKRPSDNRPEIDPYKVFTRLFQNLVAPGSANPELDKIYLRRKSLLDFVGKDLESMATRLGADDREKVQSHIAGVRQLETELERLKTGSAGCVKPPALPAGINPADLFHIDKTLPLQLQMIVAAFRCNLTQVATLQMCNSHNNGIAFPFLGQFNGTKPNGSAGDPSPYFSHHMLAHNQNASAENRGQKNAVDRYFVQQLADLMTLMKAVPEPTAANPTGTMLDNTVILFANNMGDGGAHWIDRLPWIVAGGCGGQIRTGRYLQLPSTAHNKLLTTLANAVLTEPGKAPLAYFGDARYGGEIPGLRA
jgi:hypothetical protein